MRLKDKEAAGNKYEKETRDYIGRLIDAIGVRVCCYERERDKD